MIHMHPFQPTMSTILRELEEENNNNEIALTMFMQPLIKITYGLMFKVIHASMITSHTSESSSTSLSYSNSNNDTWCIKA